ncbi:hypothetical protein DL96DRAFT_1608858 [Flagelloscypha sp. PMI_526]|nr:hypothetical protein DL96DRAFT_1608858 [Flagelloscypha sp. PMI_526]
MSVFSDVRKAPESYTIGGKDTAPLVTLDKVKGHLALLHAFTELKSKVQGISEEEISQYKGLPNVWHAYLLNPARYHEDCDRLSICKGLKLLNVAFSMFLDKFPEILASPPSEARLQFWKSRCNTWPFDPLASARQSWGLSLRCPYDPCEGMTDSFIDPYGGGYLQKNFYATCSICKRQIRQLNLALRRLTNDICSRAPADDLSQYLAGSLFTTQKTSDQSRGQKIKAKLREIIKAKGMSDIETVLMEQYMTWSTIRLWTDFDETLRKDSGTLEIVQLVLECYKSHKPFSIDLAAAVLRQFDFTNKVNAIWPNPDRFVGDNWEEDRPLIHAIARYHSFLDLMSAKQAFYVPTLDIDLAWHTHQLLAGQYGRDCFKYVGRYVDHDDKVAPTQICDGFDEMSKAWQHRFGLRYTYCGCPIPDAKTIGQRLSRILSSRNPPPHLTCFSPPIAVETSNHTHPSIHNVEKPPTYDYKYGRQYAKMSKEAEKRGNDLVEKTQKIKGPPIDINDEMTLIAAENWETGHKSYLEAVPMYIESPVAGCSTFSTFSKRQTTYVGSSPPSKVIQYAQPTTRVASYSGNNDSASTAFATSIGMDSSWSVAFSNSASSCGSSPSI